MSIELLGNEPMKASAVKILSREDCHSGFLSLARYHLIHRLFSGGWSRPVMRERLEGLAAVAVLLYDPMRDAVVMVEQFRIGALEEGAGAWLVEPAGGAIEPGEEPADVAMREAMEETGCEIEALYPIGQVHINPGLARHRLWLFCGRVDASKASGIHGVEDEDEDLRVVVMDADTLIDGLFAGEAASAAAVLVIQWLERNRDMLRGLWT